eukprot:4960354-Pyramimonas_sp.AAC.1
MMRRNVLELTMAPAHHHVLCETVPISAPVNGDVVKALATEDIGIGGLIAPLWLQRSWGLRAPRRTPGLWPLRCPGPGR